MFDPIRSYDKPGVILTQIVNGIATTDSVRRVLFDPASSSPRERESFVNSLKAEYGGNPVSDTVIDVFTNPIVWLGMLAGGAVASRNLASGGRFMAGGRPGSFSAPYAKAAYPLLRMLHLTSGSIESMGKRIASYGNEAIQLQDNTGSYLSRGLQKPIANVLTNLEKMHGVKISSLDPEMAPNEAVAHSLRLIREAMQIKRTGLMQTREELFVEGLDPDKFYITVTKPSQTRAGRKTSYLEVDKNLFDELRTRQDAETTDGTQVQDVRILDDAGLLKRIPGLKPGETLYDSMTAGGMDAMGLRVGVMHEDIPRGLSPDALPVSGVRVRYSKKVSDAEVTDVDALNSVIRDYKLDDLIAADAELYEKGKVLMYGNEKAYKEGRGFIADNEKILRVARSQLKGLKNVDAFSKDGSLNEGGVNAVLALLDDDVFNRLRRSDVSGAQVPGITVGMSKPELESVLTSAFRAVIDDPNYIPRNTTQRFDRMDRRIAANDTDPTTWVNPNAYLEASGRTRFRSKKEEQTIEHPDDLQFRYDYFGGTSALANKIKDNRQIIQNMKDTSGSYRALRVAPDEAAARYIQSTSRDYTFHAHDAGKNEAIRIANIDFSPGETPVRLPGALGRSKTGAPANVRQLETVDPELRPPGGYSLNDLIETELEAISTANQGDPFIVNQWRRNILPAITGVKPIGMAATSASNAWIKEQALRFANSDFMKAVASENKTAKRMVNSLRRWSTDLTGSEFDAVSGKVTRALYISHLGLNSGTVINNMMQPLQSIHLLGFKNTVKGYAQSLQMIGRYMTERSRMPKNATQSDIEDLQRRVYTRTFGKDSMDLVSIADLGTTFGMLEKVGYGVRGTPVGKPQFSWLEMMMKPFQYSETLNRLTTANAVLNAYEAQGMVGLKQRRDVPRAMADARMAVQQMQFGSNPITRPALFYLPVLNNPMFRQFGQYSVRTVANFFVLPGLMGGTRKTAFGEISGKGPVIINDLLRSSAVAAVVYETGKNMLGVDVSRALGAGATDIFTDSYIPPAVDITVDTLKMLGTGDFELMQDILPRILPSGIAVSRGLSTLDKSETLQALGLQKTYADWSKSQNGTVPVYQSDGRLMGEYPTSDVVLRALGTDMGRFSNSAEVNQFLLKNRDAMRDGRRRYIASVLGNNMSTAASIKGEFERRFGMPLTVTQDQMKAAIKLREEPITGRTLETITPTARDVYRQAIEQTLPGVLQGVPYTPPTEQGAVYQWAMRGKQKKQEQQD